MVDLIPKDKSFFDLFERAAANLRLGTGAMAELLDHFERVPEKIAKIKEYEHQGDEITHRAIEKLNKTFLTPIDREDIHELICRLDDILDLTDGAANRILLYKIAAPTAPARALAAILVKSAEIVENAMKGLRDIKKSDHLIKLCIDLHTQENEADRVEQQALAALFDGNLSPYDVIKWKDIYEIMEAATDRCEDVANVVESIVLKNA